MKPARASGLVLTVASAVLSVVANFTLGAVPDGRLPDTSKMNLVFIIIEDCNAGA